ncbi:MAG: DUF386 domain-containing protein [Lachnospiraceae bacterium]|jgi:biofilm protein TabA|nr:DUF386 domain-containing protein [Lachnospiraceae bacterium]
MIYANIKDTLRYCGIHPGLDLALKHVNPEFLASLGDERVELKGKDVYAFKVHLQTKPDDKTFYENHHEYIDIHVVLEGIEKMDIDTPENLELYEESPENDAYFFHGGAGQAMFLTPDKFLIAFPEDAHRTCGMVGEPRDIVKAVFKVRL